MEVMLTKEGFSRLYKNYRGIVCPLEARSYLDKRGIDFSDWLRYCKKYATLVERLDKELEDLLTVDGEIEGRIDHVLIKGIDKLEEVIMYGENMEKVKAMEMLLKTKMQFVTVKKMNKSDNQASSQVSNVVIEMTELK